MEIGEYVRLYYGKTDKVKNNDYYMQQYIECEKGLYPRENVVNHSKNIIDLIEVGDIVRVLVNIKTQETMIYTIDCEADLSLLRKWNVKSIVTKEQFKSIEYEV